MRTPKGISWDFVSHSTAAFVFDIPEIVYGLHGIGRSLALVGGRILDGLGWALPVRWMDQHFAAALGHGGEIG